MRLLSDSPAGRPSFDLSEDQIATVVDLLCSGAANAREFVTPGMLEVPITIQVRKAMLRLKKQLGFTNLQIIGEFELLDTSTNDPEVLGRIDIILQFLHQFGDEDAYLGVECKRVSPQDATLSQRYVSQGVERFISGQYAADHHWGMMLGYVLHLPVENLVRGIDGRMRQHYGEAARIEAIPDHAQALSLQIGNLSQNISGKTIRLLHIFVDMTEAAA